MKELSSEQIHAKLIPMIQQTLIDLPKSVTDALQTAYQNETQPLANFALKTILENQQLAAQNRCPLCQDTGMAVVFCRIGQEVVILGQPLLEQINHAIRIAYQQANFRMSVLDPITRKNTNDNCPCVLHLEQVLGDQLEIVFLPKGFGSENMTKLFMLNPSDGVFGIEQAVLQAVSAAGASACPPMIVGVGVGGTADKAAELAKLATLRDVGVLHLRSDIAQMESRLLQLINESGVGAQGFGGKHTALSVAIEVYPTHIAGLPVCVSLQCHCMRKGRILL